MATKTIRTRIKIRSDSKENWEALNPVLLKGEVGIEMDTQMTKTGNGSLHWVELPYNSAVDATKIPSGEKGRAGGVATLDDRGKIPEDQIPPISDSLKASNEDIINLFK